MIQWTLKKLHLKKTEQRDSLGIDFLSNFERNIIAHFPNSITDRKWHLLTNLKNIIQSMFFVCDTVGKVSDNISFKMAQKLIIKSIKKHNKFTYFNFLSYLIFSKYYTFVTPYTKHHQIDQKHRNFDVFWSFCQQIILLYLNWYTYNFDKWILARVLAR